MVGSLRQSGAFVRRSRSVVFAALGVLAMAAGSGCTGTEPTPQLTDLGPPAAGALRGEIVQYTLRFEDEGGESQYFLRTATDGPEQRLYFATAPNLASGAVVDVWGTSRGDGGLDVQRFAEVKAAGVERNQHALVKGTPLRARKFALILIDLGQGVRLPTADAQTRMFGTGPTDNSLRQWFWEASYGHQDIGGMVIGPIKATMTGCNFGQLTNNLRAQVPAGFDHYLWYFGARVQACVFAGAADTGTPARPRKDTWYNASIGCNTLVQEPVHNFGALHSSSMRCPNASFIDAPNMVCRHDEYGDSYDPMGRGCRHMNGYQKAFQGWFGGCNVVEVKSTATVNLLPIETPCDGPQVLQVAMPKTRPFFRSGGGGPSGITELTHYYLEYRAPLGFDKGLTPVVQVRVSGDIRERTVRGFNTWILDMNPATPVFEGLVAGGTFTDPLGGIKFTVVSIDAKQAAVKVEIPGGSGGLVCLDGKALPSPAPGPESCAAAPASLNGAPPPDTDAGASTPTPSDAGASTGGTSGGSGGSSGATGGSSGSGELLPLPYDAGTAGGFGENKPSGSSGGSSGSGNGSGSKGTGGSSGGGSAPPVDSGNVPSGGCSFGGGNGAPGGELALAALGLVVASRRRRRPRA